MSSRGVNKVILVGNLGQDPEVRFSPNGVAIANLRLATSESWKGQDGQVQERTEWHRIVMYRRLAEIAGEYVKKGAKLYIEGKLQTRKWQDKDGQDRYTTEIVADEMQMLDGRPGAGGDAPSARQGGGNWQGGGNAGGGQGFQGGGRSAANHQPAAAASPNNGAYDGGGPGFFGDDDDIPFQKLTHVLVI